LGTAALGSVNSTDFTHRQGRQSMICLSDFPRFFSKVWSEDEESSSALQKSKTTQNRISRNFFRDLISNSSTISNFNH